MKRGFSKASKSRALTQAISNNKANEKRYENHRERKIMALENKYFAKHARHNEDYSGAERYAQDNYKGSRMLHLKKYE